MHWYTNQPTSYYTNPNSILPQQQIPSYPQTPSREIVNSIEPSINPDFQEISESRAGQAFTFTLTDNGGGFEKRLNLAGTVNSSSKVFVSISEVGVFNGQVKPFMGAASMQVHNVVPHDDGTVIVRGHIGWESTLTFRLSVVVF